LNLKALGALLVIAVVSLLALTPVVSAQATLPFSFSLNTTRGVLTISNIFYSVGFDLSHGARAYFWWVNISQPTLLPVIPYNTTRIPTPLVSISAPNSTTVPLPGALSSTAWQASEVSSNYYTTTFELTANASLTAPFLLRVYVTFSRLTPLITYHIVITNLGTMPASATLAYGIGYYLPSASQWKAAGTVVLANGSIGLVTLSNGSQLASPINVISVEETNGSPGLVIGLTNLPSGALVMALEGELFGAGVNSTFLVATFTTPLISPQGNYSVTFQAFATGFNAYELASVGAVLPAYYLYPNDTNDIQMSMGVSSVVSSLKSTIADLNSTISSLEQELNNTSAKLYWYYSHLEQASRAESYYLSEVHRGGILAAGMFVVGVVIGLLGGAFFLSPRGAEAVAKKPARAKK